MPDVMTPPTARLEQKTAARTEEAVKIYGKGQTEVRALDGVTVEFAAGRYTAVMGPSGSGKSTLLHCVAGLDSLTSGRAFIGDVDLSTLNDQRLTILRRDRVGFVFQAFNLVPTISAAKNITLPLLLAGRKGDQAWISQVIEITGIGDRLEHQPRAGNAAPASQEPCVRWAVSAAGRRPPIRRKIPSARTAAATAPAVSPASSRNRRLRSVAAITTAAATRHATCTRPVMTPSAGPRSSGTEAAGPRSRRDATHETASEQASTRPAEISRITSPGCR